MNDSNEDISLLMSDNGVDGGGIVLKANGGLYEINMWNFWDGYVYAICASGAKTLSFVEVTNYARF
ncbi:MAG: hypothetical protein KJ971_08580 [Firmicutes bacterium]|nr:hypothetical protein [Bacillota bacterium]